MRKALTLRLLLQAGIVFLTGCNAANGTNSGQQLSNFLSDLIRQIAAAFLT